MSKTSLIERPIITERATELREIGKYVFKVLPSATKSEIRKAIKEIYKVDVVSVNIINRPPKAKRYRGLYGKQSGYKKAVITLGDGQKITIE